MDKDDKNLDIKSYYNYNIKWKGRSRNMRIEDYLDETVPYKSKRKKAKTKKSDHKHNYIPVIVLTYFSLTSESPFISIGKECNICGKVISGKMVTVKENENSRFSRLITDLDTVKSLYPNLRVIENNE